jgi:hypothetical protein
VAFKVELLKVYCFCELIRSGPMMKPGELAVALALAVPL